jgi:hypothetical protein
MFSAVFLGHAQTTDLRVGMSMGEWETVMSWKPDSHGSSSFSRDGRKWSVAFGKAKTVHNTTRVTLKSSCHTYGKWKKRLVAVAGDGAEHAAWIGNSSAGDYGTAVFRDLPRSSIKEFQLQMRPYLCVEFRGISLQPGQRTQVTVVSSDDAGNAKK